MCGSASSSGSGARLQEIFPTRRSTRRLRGRCGAHSHILRCVYNDRFLLNFLRRCVKKTRPHLPRQARDKRIRKIGFKMNDHFVETVLGAGRERQRHVLRRAAGRSWGPSGQSMGALLPLEPGQTAPRELLCHHPCSCRYELQCDCKCEHVPDEAAGFAVQG